MTAAALLLPLIAMFQPVTPRLDARLVTADDTLAPGMTTDLAIVIKVEKDWHIYDPITLDTGAPTEISLKLPAGVSVGDLLWPAPYLGQEAGLEYLAHEGEITVLTELTLGPDAPVGPFTIKAEVFALACRKLCVPVKAEASLLVNDPTATPIPDRAAFFKEARELLPVPLDKAQYVRGSRILASVSQIPVGGEGEVVALIKVKKGLHIQGRRPPEGFFATRVFIQSRDGIVFDKDAQSWPEPHMRTVEGFGTLPEYAGDVLIRFPFAVADEAFEPGAVKLSVLFQYQACDDETGRCFLPTMARTSVEFEVVPAGAPAVPNPDPIIAALPPLPAPTAASRAPSASTFSTPSLPVVFLFAFLGGVILNVMPCVLPVISLKIFGFVQQARDDPARVLRMGLVYAAGIMASFAIIAIVMVSAKMAWGGLMQQPGFLIGLSAVVFAFALSLLGVFEIQLPGAAASAASRSAAKEGYGAAFFNGIMATLLATPCVGPFLGSAVGVLARMDSAVAATGIMLVGVGLATPYVLLTAFPGWLRYLPKPGPWMVTFKQIVGFILVVVVLWLLSVLVKLIDDGAMLGTLGLLTGVGIGCWIVGRINLSMSFARAAIMWLVALAFVGGCGALSYTLFAERETSIPWQPWEPGIAERLAEEGYNVYVDYTATWCLTCQTNKRLVLETDRIASEFQRLGIYPVKADFTGHNKQIQEELLKHGRNGVPLNIVVPAGKPDQVQVLPELLTTQIVLDALGRLEPTAGKPEFWSSRRTPG